MKNFFFSPQKFTHLLTSTPKIGHKHISTTYHPHPHVNSIDQPLTHHDLLSPNIDTLLTISLQMSICSMSKLLITQQKMIKTPPLLVMSKIKNYWTSSTHMTVCQCNWPISWTPRHWPPGRAGKKMATIFDLITKSKIFFKKNLNVPHAPNIEPLLLHWCPLNTPVSSKNVGYTDATIGCSLKQPKIQNDIADTNADVLLALGINGPLIFSKWSRIAVNW